MKTPDREELWRDALDDAARDGFSEAALARTLCRARHLRRTRGALRMAAGAGIIIGAALVGAVFFQSPDSRRKEEPVSALLADAKGTNAISVRYLTDDDLLARFPNQPVGLAGSGSTREFLVLANATNN